MSSAAHKIRFSSGYCFGPNNRNGVFTPSNNDPINLRQHLNIALSSTTPAYFANPRPQVESCEDRIVPDTCDMSRFADILSFSLPAPPNCISAFDAFYAAIFVLCPNNAPATTVQEHLLCVLNALSDYSLAYAIASTCDPASEPFEVVVIFDNKMPVTWGKLVYGIFPTLVRQISSMPFPLNFETFEITMYKVQTKTHYSDPRGVYVTNI